MKSVIIEPIKLTIFLDILGYREHIKNINTNKKAKETIAKFKINELLSQEFTKLHNYSEYDTNIKISDVYELKTIFVSDSIIISYMPKSNESFVNFDNDLISENNGKIFIIISSFIAQLQILTISTFNLFLRGGISDKFSFIEEYKAVGIGINEAYELESKYAIYPRIIIEKGLLEKYNINNYINEVDEYFINSSKFYSIDKKDNFYYINYFSTFKIFEETKNMNKEQLETNINNLVNFIVLHNKLIEKEMNENKNNIKLLEKYFWLKEFQNVNFRIHYNNDFVRKECRNRKINISNFFVPKKSKSEILFLTIRIKFLNLLKNIKHLIFTKFLT